MYRVTPFRQNRFLKPWSESSDSSEFSNPRFISFKRLLAELYGEKAFLILWDDLWVSPCMTYVSAYSRETLSCLCTLLTVKAYLHKVRQLLKKSIAPLMVLIFMCFSNHLIKIKQGDEKLLNMLWTNNYCQFNPTGNISVLWAFLLFYSWSSIKQCMQSQFPGSGGLFLPFFSFQISSVIVYLIL